MLVLICSLLALAAGIALGYWWGFTQGAKRRPPRRTRVVIGGDRG